MGSFSSQGLAYISEEQDKAMPGSRVFPGDVLLNITGASVGRVCVAPAAHLPANVNQHVCIIRCKDTLRPEYLAYVLASARLQNFIWDSQAGATRQALTKQMIEEFRIPWVDDDRQRQIVRDLSAQLAAAADARQAARTQAAEADALIDAVYRQAFQDIVPVAVPPEFEEAPADWRWMKLGELAQLESGHTPSRARPDWWGGDVSWVSLTEIRALDGQWVESTQIKTNEAGIANSSARILPRGTVCFSRTASVGFVTIMAKPMATSQDFANWVCGDELDPEYLMHALIRSRVELRALATGATHKTIYMPLLEAFHLCLPDRPTQERIVRDLKEQLAAARQIQTGLHARLTEIEQLPARLLAQVFDTL